MAFFSQNASKILGKLRFCTLSDQELKKLFRILPVPLAVAATVVQASIYDVPGGYRAVMFDRFSGVNDKVRKHWTIHEYV